MKKEANILSLEEISRIVASICINYPVLRAYLFGSYARGDQETTSDIDLYIELDESQPIGGLVAGGLYSNLESALGTGIDTFFSDTNKLRKRKPRLHSSIERDKVLLYDGKEKCCCSYTRNI
jgi:predicted nucleotidyltransferase